MVLDYCIKYHITISLVLRIHNVISIRKVIQYNHETLIRLTMRVNLLFIQYYLTRLAFQRNSIHTMASPSGELPQAVLSSIEKINDLITTDAGGRGMKHLVVPGDLLESAKILARLVNRRHITQPPHVVILTGFPCCVDESPPMETDGLASVAIARAVIQLGYEVTLITEECNAPVFRAAVNDANDDEMSKITLSFCPSLANPDTIWLANNYAVMKQLTATSDLVIACERAGPAQGVD